jgi:hypothetical protein
MGWFYSCLPNDGNEENMFFRNYLLMNEAGEGDVSGGGDVVEAVAGEAIDAGEGDVGAIDASGDGGDAQLDAAADAIEEAIEDGATDAEVQAMIETFKFKANGEEKEVTLDWNNKEDIIKRLQMAEAAPSAMHRAAEIEKAYKNDVQALKDDFWGMAEKAGHDPDALAEARIQAQIERLQMSPEQVAQAERDAELQELREKVKKGEEDKQTAEFQKLQKQAEVDLEAEITEAISATTQLPKSPYVMKRVADAMSWFMDQEDEQGQPKYPDISAKDVMPVVEKEMTSEIKDMLEGMPVEVLNAFLSEQVKGKLRAQRLAKMPKNLKTTDTGKKTSTEVKQAQAPKQSIRDFLKHGLKKEV